MGSLFEPIFEALNQAGVRYVVVGGLAVVLHGHARLTVDVDLVVDLTPQSAAAAVNALTSLGFTPAAPVSPAGFADPAQRERWIREKGMQVFSMIDAANPLRRVDLFVEYPAPFDDLWARSVEVGLERETVHVASIDDLIAMKRTAGRTQDLADIEALEAIREEMRRPDEA